MKDTAVIQNGQQHLQDRNLNNIQLEVQQHKNT